MFLIKSFFSIYLLVVIYTEQSSSFCKPFDQSSGLAALCGYSATVNFTHQSHYDDAVKNVKLRVKLFSSCFEYAKLIFCSLNVPRCEPYIEGPYLPCRTVCDEFSSKCSSKIALYGMQFIIGMCRLLPHKDNPNTTLGYRGRCFEPPNFKTSVAESPPLKCHNLIVPVCQNIGFTRTILAEDKQKAYSSLASNLIKAVSDKPECELPRKKLLCTEIFPPCVNGTELGSYCRPKCERFYNMNCTPAMQSRDVSECMNLPGGTADNDVCSYSHWPKAMNWPQVRGTPQPVISTSATRQPVSTDIRPHPTTESVTFSSKPTSTETKVNITGHNPNLEESNKPKMAAVIGGVFAVLLVIVIALTIAYIIYRKRSKSRNSSRHRREQKKNQLINHKNMKYAKECYFE